jgi:hypothetical protein
MALPADPAPDPPYRGESPPALGAPFRRSCQAPPLGTFDTGEFSRRPRGAQHARHLRHQKQFVVERDDARMHRADADRDRFSLPLSAACRFPSHVSFMAAGVCRVIQSSPNASCTARAIKWRSGPSSAQSKAARRHRLDFDKSRSSNSAAMLAGSLPPPILSKRACAMATLLSRLIVISATFLVCASIRGSVSGNSLAATA